jgi:hypothetical protein
MALLRRLYVNALFGALGGLLGWMLFGELVSPQWSWTAQQLGGGALIGAMIGGLVVSVDALLDRALVRFVRFAAVGILLGGLGGAVGFWLGERVHYSLVPSTGELSTAGLVGVVLARGLGWMFFGLAVGCAEGVAARSWRKTSYGALGGTLGGLLGGALFGAFMAYGEPGQRSYIWGQALGLSILGAFIGALMAAVEAALKPAALLVLRGWQEGREFPVVKSRSIVGRDESVDILLLRDMGIAKRHLAIERRGEGYVLAAANGSLVQTLLNGRPARPQQPLAPPS